MAMQEYIPTPWINGAAPAINSGNLLHGENGIKDVTDEVIAIEDGTVPVGRALKADELTGGAEVPGASPIGAMLIWPSTSIPADWEICLGQEVAVASFPELYNVLGTTFGQANPSVFNLPDMQGMFVRGFDSANINDPELDREFGSAQADEFKAHEHTVSNVGQRVGDGASDDNMSAAPDITRDVITTPTGGEETRPKNIALNYIVRAK